MEESEYKKLMKFINVFKCTHAYSSHSGNQNRKCYYCEGTDIIGIERNGLIDLLMMYYKERLYVQQQI